MDNCSLGESNTIKLIELIKLLPGENFREQCARAKDMIESHKSKVTSGTRDWERLIKLDGLLRTIIRHDADEALPIETIKSAFELHEHQK